MKKLVIAVFIMMITWSSFAQETILYKNANGVLESVEFSADNGFHELLVRHDAAKELIKVYVKMDPLVIDRNWTSLQKGTYSFQFTCIEMLLSHGVIVRQLDETDIRVLLNEAISKYKSKKQMEDMCSLWYLSPTAGLCLSILEKDGLLIKSNSDLQLFQQTFMTEDIEILERIIEESEKRIKL
ncbi:MAG: hypothetical protein ACOXZO_09685 [Bacteroidales bacterium]|jgi:hypothetical protein